MALGDSFAVIGPNKELAVGKMQTLKSNEIETISAPQENKLQEGEGLLDQFYGTLRVMYLAADTAHNDNNQSTEQHELIRKLLSERPRTWRGAYEIEQMLAFVMTDKQVSTELSRRLAEAKALGLTFVDNLEVQYKNLSEKEQVIEDDAQKLEHTKIAKRYILHRTLNDLQWFYNQRIRRRQAAAQLSFRISIMFFGAFLFFSMLLFVQFSANQVPESSIKEISFLFKIYPGILIAMSAGFLGATFSMLIHNRRRVLEGSLEDLNAALNWRTLIVRGSVGLGAAAILYFFFESGLIEGNIWPNLEALAYSELSEAPHIRVPNQHWCLLVIWCFLAGFSETLVPTLLQKTEHKGSAI